ncbi:MAG TPA: hypothetical protein DDW52_28445 [Planctomycetaceae bacterium]|nr:hypothetical protein [Planctomycetaceae bacterium]
MNAKVVEVIDAIMQEKEELEEHSASDRDLLGASSATLTLTERRKSVRRVFFDRRQNSKTRLGLEITQDGVTLAIARSTAEGISLKTDYIAFEQELPDSPCELSLDSNKAALTTAISELVERHRISGQPVKVALGGSPCVTRVAFGENNSVDADIEETRQRAERYLSLGRGDKISAYAERKIDAKRKRAWLTVAHGEVVNSIATAVESAGLRLAGIEHSLVTLCWAVGEQGFDANEPVLVLRQQTGRPAIAVSYQGELILDYRPSRLTLEQLPSDESPIVHILSQHIKCLRRYLAPQVPRTAGQLTKVYCVGGDVAFEASREELAEYGLELVELSLDAQFQDVDDVTERERSESLPAACIAREAFDSERQATNLADSLKQHARISAKTLTQTFWPLAATILLLIGAQVWSMNVSAQITEVAAKLDATFPLRTEFERVRRDLAKLENDRRDFDGLLTATPPKQFNHLVKFAGRALPEGAWLRSIRAQSDSSVHLSGASFSEDGIYEYLAALRASKLFTHVTLEGTSSTRLRSGPAVEFEITTVADKQVRDAGNSVANSINPLQLPHL